MIDVAERPRIRPAGSRGEPAIVALARRLDWILLLAAFALVYVIAARLILREEYGYLVRALSRRKAA